MWDIRDMCALYDVFLTTENVLQIELLRGFFPCVLRGFSFESIARYKPSYISAEIVLK